MSQTISALPTLSFSRHPGLVDRIAAAASLLVAAAGREWRLRGDRQALESLDGRGLADIGIGRGQIPSAVRLGRGGLDRAEPSLPDGAPSPMPSSWTEWR